MKFNTAYKRNVGKFTPIGSRYNITYALDVINDLTGEKGLVETGKVDSYALIQSHHDTCSLKSMIARFNNGDLTALVGRQGSYGDYSDLPTNINDLNTEINSLRKKFAESEELVNDYGTFKNFVNGIKKSPKKNIRVSTSSQEKVEQKGSDDNVIDDKNKSV